MSLNSTFPCHDDTLRTNNILSTTARYYALRGSKQLNIFDAAHVRRNQRFLSGYRVIEPYYGGETFYCRARDCSSSTCESCPPGTQCL